MLSMSDEESGVSSDVCSAFIVGLKLRCYTFFYGFSFFGVSVKYWL